MGFVRLSCVYHGHGIAAKSFYHSRGSCEQSATLIKTTTRLNSHFISGVREGDEGENGDADRYLESFGVASSLFWPRGQRPEGFLVVIFGFACPFQRFANSATSPPPPD